MSLNVKHLCNTFKLMTFLLEYIRIVNVIIIMSGLMKGIFYTHPPMSLKAFNFKFLKVAHKSGVSPPIKLCYCSLHVAKF